MFWHRLPPPYPSSFQRKKKEKKMNIQTCPKYGGGSASWIKSFRRDFSVLVPHFFYLSEG